MSESGWKPRVNIGVVGHVDHGKSTLVKALTGVWTARHSEEIKRGMTIKLGFANAYFYRCPNCGNYGVSEVCKVCGSKTEFVRSVSFVDSPGHEVLMARMLSGAAVMDGAMLVIAANESCPQPQTREHFTALDVLGIRNLVIVQNKVDVVTRERAIESYREIAKMVAGTWAENAPIIPLSALRELNISELIQALIQRVPLPERDPNKRFRMYVIRSFDVNKPGTPPEGLRGGVIGGSVVSGALRLGEEVEVLPGFKDSNNRFVPLAATVLSMKSDSLTLDVADPGGLIGIETDLDPAVAKADSLAGCIVGKAGDLPKPTVEIQVEARVFQRVVGTKELMNLGPLKAGEQVVVTIGPAITTAMVKSYKSGALELRLSRPVIAERGDKVAVSRKVLEKWRLSGYGTVK
jgi:translation initiation factor 2 subunit 3